MQTQHVTLWAKQTTLFAAVAFAALAGPAAAQSRPQLVIVQAEPELAAETLLIQGENFVWANDNQAVVTLAGNPLTVLSITAGHILAQLPPALAPGGYLLKVSRADNVRIRNEGHALHVRRALTRASRRLATPKCQRVFHEFRDGAGRPLQERLDAETRSSEAHLASLLFYDGSAHPRCRSKHTWAVAVPGSQVIRVCTAQFIALAERHPRIAAGVLIHEQLHALGLEENPPTSAEITERVITQCAP